jgi:hypothetical protein
MPPGMFTENFEPRKKIEPAPADAYQLELLIQLELPPSEAYISERGTYLKKI